MEDPKIMEEIDKMFVIFYKVSYGGGKEATFFDKALDKVIGWWTSDWKSRFNGEWNKGYCHTEMLYVFREQGMKMISSSIRDGGVREKEHTINTQAWDYVDVSTLNRQSAYLFEKEACSKNKGYDYAGIFGFVFNNNNNPRKWFCSEITLKALQICGCVGLEGYNASRTSPNKLFKLLHDKGGFVPGDPPTNLPKGTRSRKTSSEGSEN